VRLAVQRAAQVAQPTAGQVASHPSAMPTDLIELGRIGEPYGVKGWVNVFPHSEDAGTLKRAKSWFITWYDPFAAPDAKAGPAAGQNPMAASPSAADALSIAVVQSRMHSGRLVAQLQGIDDRSLAEKLKGASIWVSRADFPPPRKGEFYWVDLVGVSVINREGVDLGTVTAVTDHGAHPILCIDAGTDAEERLIPFVDAYIDGVDLAAKTIRVDWQADY